MVASSPIATVRWRDATLDHMFDSNATFRQKFLVHDAHWRHNRSGPLLLYFGNEGAIEDFWNASGALFELAPPLNALVVALEHRYYGASQPFGAKSLDSAHTLRYLSVEQALADMAEFLARKSELLGCARAAAAPSSSAARTAGCCRRGTGSSIRSSPSARSPRRRPSTFGRARVERPNFAT